MFLEHAKKIHDGIDWDEQDEVVRQRSKVAWKLYFYQSYDNDRSMDFMADVCREMCGVELDTREKVI